jgi:hypothetical protein
MGFLIGRRARGGHETYPAVARSPGGGGAGITQLTQDVKAGPGSGSVPATMQGIQTVPVAATPPVQSAVPVFDVAAGEYDIRPLTESDILVLLTQAAWYVDPVGGKDTNPGTLASPVKTVMGGIVPKWGTNRPNLPQNTNITFLNSETVNQENIALDITLTDGATVFGILGAYVPHGAATTLSSVTAKNRATATRLSVHLTAPPAGLAIGQFIHNTTKGSRATIVAIAGAVLTMSQPLTAAAIGNVFAVPAEDDTWAATDHVQVEIPLSINLTRLTVSAGNLDITNKTPTLQALNFLDSSGNGNGSVTLNVECGVVQDVTSAASLESQAASYVAVNFSSFLNRNFNTGQPGVFIGGFASSEPPGVGESSSFGPAFLGGFIEYLIVAGFCGLDFDVQVVNANISSGTIVAGLYYIGAALYIGNVSNSGLATFYGGGQLTIDELASGELIVWGPGQITLGLQSNINVSFTTYTDSFLQTGAFALFLGNSGTSLAAAAFNQVTGAITTGIEITPANIDAKGGLFWPLTGMSISSG